MPAYLQWFTVDWGWNQRTDTERVLIRRCEASLRGDPFSATEPWLQGTLEEISSRLPGVKILAALIGEEDDEILLYIQDGKSERTDPGGEHKATFERLSEASDAELFPNAITAQEFKEAGIEKIARSLFYPARILEEMRAEAVRTDRSLSYLAQQAWLAARSKLLELDSPEAFSDLSKTTGTSPELPDRQKLTLYFPVDMYFEIMGLATRLDCSRSRLLQLAWLLAHDELLKRPSSD